MSHAVNRLIGKFTMVLVPMSFCYYVKLETLYQTYYSD